MGVLKVKDPADATGNTWIDIAGTGTQGPPGGPVPVGGNPGEVIVKTGPADMEVGWVARPRIAAAKLTGIVNSHATANTMGNLITVPVTIYPDRVYHIFASVRAIQDPGALVGFAQFAVHVGPQMEGYDCVAGPDTGLWGAWSQTWLKNGDDLNSTGAPTTVDATLGVILNAANKQIYAPRLYIIEY